MASNSNPRPLPQGWRIEGLWSGIGAGNPRYKEVGARISDSEIEAADRIVVSYTSRRTGSKEYRTIHGATSKRSVGSLIRTTVKRTSPVGRENRG